MGAFLIVDGDPLARNFPNLAERLEHVSTQDIMPEGAIEAFDVGILVRFPFVNILDDQTGRFCPGHEGRVEKLRTVIDTKALG